MRAHKPVSGTPVTPLPIGNRTSPRDAFVPTPVNGKPTPLPHNSLNDHVADRADPHQTTKLVPKMRTGSGAPSVNESDKETDLYFDVAGSVLYVCVRIAGALAWRRTTPNASDEVYNFSHETAGIRHYKKQVLVYDSEMEAYTLSFIGDYVRSSDGSYVAVS